MWHRCCPPPTHSPTDGEYSCPCPAAASVPAHLLSRYFLPCPLEPVYHLQPLVQRVLVREGIKVLTQGAELEGGEEGCHPLHQEGEVGGEAGSDLAPCGQT